MKVQDMLSFLNPTNFLYLCVSLEDLAARYQNLVGKSQEEL